MFIDLDGGFIDGSRHGLSTKQRDIPHPHLIATKGTDLYANHEHNKQTMFNVISEVGTTNNNKIPFANMYLDAANALTPLPPPMTLPLVDRTLHSVQPNSSTTKMFFPPKNNPNVYTVGGVLSGMADIDHFFKQTLQVSMQTYCQEKFR